VADECDRWEWQELFASEHGPPDPATRHVLHILVMYLFKGSRSAFPSQRRIALMTGLHVKSVRRHLEAAKKKGWLKRRENKRRGKAGIWYEYFPTIPKRLNSRRDTMSHRENSRGEILSSRGDTVSTTMGNLVPHEGTPCPPNQVLNQALNHVLNKSESRNVVNDVFRGRPGVEWKEAIALARQIGFRDPDPNEKSKAYMAAARSWRDNPPVVDEENVKKLRRKVAMINGEMRLVTVSAERH
jgi:hypothetical protein